MKSPFAKIFSLLICLFVCALGSAQIKQDAPLPIDPHVKIGKLSNGLVYYIRKNTRPEKKVELRLVVNTGSIMEDDDQQGSALSARWHIGRSDAPRQPGRAPAHSPGQ